MRRSLLAAALCIPLAALVLAVRPAVAAPPFADVPPGHPAYAAVTALAARGIIRGCDPPGDARFCPDDRTLREQMAALIVRAMPGWAAETGQPTFTDNTADTELMTRVATLQRHGVVRGYQEAACLAQGTPPPCYGPLDTVKYGQVLLVVARAMVSQGYWSLQADDRGRFPDQVGPAGADPETDRQTLDHRMVVTYVAYAGAPPDVAAARGAPFAVATPGRPAAGWGDPATRAWVARALWQVLGLYPARFPAPAPGPSPVPSPTPGPSPAPSPVASPSAAPGGSNPSIAVGPGFSDVSPHQLVRTSGDVLYAVVPTCDAYPACPGSTLRVYRADRPGVPAAFAEQDAAHRPAGAGTSALAVDGADRLHVAWLDRAGRALYATFDTAANLWGPAEVLDATGWTTFGQGDEGVALALDAAGTPHAAWNARGGDGALQIWYASRPAAGWTAPVRVDDVALAPNHSAWHPTLAFAPDGTLLLAWLDGSFNYTPDGTIRVRTRAAGGTWQPSLALPDAAMTTIDNGPALLVTADGVRHLAFLDTGDAVRYWYDAGPGWRGDRQPARQVTHDPALGPDGAGGVYLYGHGTPQGDLQGHGDNLYRFRLPAGASAWGPWTLYVTGAFDSSVSTRWAQFFHAHPERVDVLYWADPYPNVLYAGAE